MTVVIVSWLNAYCWPHKFARIGKESPGKYIILNTTYAQYLFNNARLERWVRTGKRTGNNSIEPTHRKLASCLLKLGLEKNLWKMPWLLQRICGSKNSPCWLQINIPNGIMLSLFYRSKGIHEKDTNSLRSTDTSSLWDLPAASFAETNRVWGNAASPGSWVIASQVHI